MKRKQTSFIKLIRIWGVVFLTALAGVIVAIDLAITYHAFNIRIDNMRADHEEQQKQMSKREVERVVNMINHERTQSEILTKNRIKSRVYEAHAIAQNIFQQNRGAKSDAEIQQLIIDALMPVRFESGSGYYSIIRLDGVGLLFADKSDSKGLNLLKVQDVRGQYVIKDMIDIAKQSGEGFYEFHWTKPRSAGRDFKKLSFVKRFEPYEWFIGTGLYVDDIDEQIKSAWMERINNIRYGKNRVGYLFVDDWRGKSLAHGAQPDLIGTDMWEYEDSRGNKTTQLLVAASKKKDGGYANFWWRKPDTGKESYKIAYAKAVPEWGLFVGSGGYVDDVEQDIATSQAALKAEIQAKIFLFTIIVAIALALFILLFNLLSNRLKKDFTLFISFFDQAFFSSKTIDSNKLGIEEFVHLSDSVNHMVKGRSLAAEKINESDNFLKMVIEESPFPMWVSDSHGTLITINKSCRKLLNISEEEVVGKYNILKDNMVIEQGLLPLVESVYQNGKKVNFVISWAAEKLQGLALSDSAPVILDVTITPVVDKNGHAINAIIQHQDITEVRKAEARIKYLNRVYAVLSGINSLIAHTNDREALFREACNIVVEKGGFHMAMLLTVDRGTGQTASFVSSGMEDMLLSAIKSILSTSDGVQSSIFAQSIREKEVVVFNDVMLDPEVSLRKECEESGVRSLIVLPLIVAGEAAGVIALYASEIGFFQEEEIKLLTELAGDIAYAINHIDKQEQLNYLAYNDELTGLANRTLLFERLAQHMRRAADGGHKLALGLIDLERFKNINDSLGRPAGDVMLKQVAEWLAQQAGDVNLLARIDTDHFAIILPEVRTGGNLVKLVDKMIAAFLEHSFRLNDAVFRIGIKVGIALFPDDGDDADILFKNAEAALKKAKTSGDRFLLYTQKMTAAVASKLALENQLRLAIDNDEFMLYYQPKVNLVSGKVTGAEALIRWNNPETGLVPPGEFIPLLEETGLIYEVGRWALGKAIEDNLRWRAAGLPAIRIAVNASPLQLRNINFLGEIEQAIAISAQAATGLELEITEGVFIDDLERNIVILNAIRDMGITVAIDDFGTGFSSLSYLAKLPVDTLKIDRAFVTEMTTSSEGLALVSTIVHLAHSLNLNVVAEGVETEEQSHLLRLLQCDEMQGFLFSKPVPGDIFESRFLAAPALKKKTGVENGKRRARNQGQTRVG